MFLFLLSNLAMGASQTAAQVFYIWLMGDQNCESIG